MSFDFIAIIILINISIINNLCRNHLRPSSQQYWQFQIIFTVKQRAMQTFILKLIAEDPRYFFCLLFISGVFETDEKTFILKQPCNLCLFFMTQKLVSPVQVSLVLGAFKIQQIIIFIQRNVAFQVVFKAEVTIHSKRCVHKRALCYKYDKRVLYHQLRCRGGKKAREKLQASG